MYHNLLKKIPQTINMQFTRNLINDSKYGFLKQLGLANENPGLYDGKWGGSGKVSLTKKNSSRKRKQNKINNNIIINYFNNNNYYFN